MAAAPLPPSVYVSRLRRAFFLRVHPDRFRAHDAVVRQQQARLVQALNDRMSWSDFLSYNYNGSTSSSRIRENSSTGSLPFVLEHRNGSLLHKTLQLDDTVDNILRSMSQALKDSGAASLPPPPKVRNDSSSNNTRHSRSAYNGVDPRDNIIWTKDRSRRQQQRDQQDTNIDHRFDINTTKGRDLLAFCRSLDRTQVEERRQFRMDANAAALMGRRLYQFQSIDGTSLHWSSKSFAILMASLMEVHEEHSKKFKTDTFYPLRLVFSNHDFDVQDNALDLFGGVLHLHPANTKIQWLEILQLVTPERLEILRCNRKTLEEAQLKIQSVLGIKLKKGFTCQSSDYYHFVLNFAHHLKPRQHQIEGLVEANSAVALESIQVVVEAVDACRFRCVLTQEGQIRVGVGMSADKVLAAIHRDSAAARERRDIDRKARALSDQQARQVQWELG